MSHGQHFKSLDVLRLEVEVEPTGPFNLILNPDGELGGWGWVTPVANTSLRRLVSGGVSHLSYRSALNVANYFYSEPMPVAAGQYAAARWVLGSNGSAYYRTQLEWLNSSETVIGSGGLTGYLPITLGTQSISGQLAPANTAFVRLRFDLYKDTTGANLTADPLFYLRDVAVAKAATAAALGSSRKNLILNPSFEGAGVPTWEAEGTDAALAATTAQVYVGGQALALTYSRAATWGSFRTSVAVNPGRDYVFQYRSRAATVARPTFVGVQFYDANGEFAGPGIGRTTVANTTTGWTVSSLLVTAPTNAATVRVYGGVTDAAPNEVHYFDAAMVTEGVDVPAYFDGSFAASGSKTYSWSGTAHASTSTLTDSTLGSLVPTEWRNVLGPSHEVQIDREALNLGTLTATILDATLDPSQTSSLRPGRRVRMLAQSGTRWEPLFTGKSTRLDVEYDEKAFPAKPPRISLTAVDNTQPLAAARRPEGVGTIAALPYVLEGAGVPWAVNGSSHQVASATVVSSNENATALDQIAITRDSELGYAWVDRRGVLTAWDQAWVPLTDGSNLVTNSGFETDASGWATATASTSIASSSAQARTGTKSLAISNTSTAALSACGAKTSPEFSVARSHKYNVRAYARASTATRQARIQYAWYGSAGLSQLLSSTNGPLVDVGTTGWTELSLTVESPANAYFMVIYVYFYNVAASETNYVDDVNVWATPTLLDESVYSDFDVSFSSEECINSVNVKYLRHNAALGVTEEIPYGPYEDAASVAEWGRRSAEFTVHGISEGSVATYANSVLARNAKPVLQVNSVTVPVSETSHISTRRALLDLYDLVKVTNAAKSINHDLRITRITHRISPEKWLVDLGFSGAKSVASPQQTPPVQNEDDSGWVTPTFSNGWNQASYSPVRYRRHNGVVFFVGVLFGGALRTTAFTLPVGFRPRQDLRVSGWGGDASGQIAGYVVAVDGRVLPFHNAANGGEYSLDSISFLAEG